MKYWQWIIGVLIVLGFIVYSNPSFKPQLSSTSISIQELLSNPEYVNSHKEVKIIGKYDESTYINRQQILGSVTDNDGF